MRFSTAVICLDRALRPRRSKWARTDAARYRALAAGLKRVFLGAGTQEATANAPDSVQINAATVRSLHLLAIDLRSAFTSPLR